MTMYNGRIKENRVGADQAAWMTTSLQRLVLVLAAMACMLCLSSIRLVSMPTYAAEAEKTSTKTGWVTEGGNTYYFQNGKKAKGLVKIGKKYYYFAVDGVQKTGWIKIKGKKYYFDPEKKGRRASGWTNIGTRKYYFKSSGLPATGWLKKNGKVYYLTKKGKAVYGWKTIDGRKYYFLKPSGERATGVVTINGTDYTFNSDGVQVTYGFSQGKFTDSTGSSFQRASIKKLLLTALKPVGSTLYIWGGGWNKNYDGKITGQTMGVSSYWATFFNSQDKKYDYTKYRYHYEKGLDCSGYVAWVIYNTFNSTSGHQSFVMLAQNMAKSFSNYGWGTYKAAGSVSDFKAGDIMSLAEGHVYIVVGSCSDGSIVLLHASPPGVMLTGTTTKAGNKNSEAIKLATAYMKKYFPAFYAKFPDTSRGASYLTSYAQMRWYAGGSKSLMADPENYRNKDAKMILMDLFGG